MSNIQILFPFESSLTPGTPLEKGATPALFVGKGPRVEGQPQMYYTNWHPPILAAGTVTVPAGLPLRLDLGDRAHLRRLLETDLSRIDYLDVSASYRMTVDGEDVKNYLSRLTHLKGLSLAGTDVTDKDLLHLANLTALEELNLERTRVSTSDLGGPGLYPLRCLTNLRYLNLRKTYITGGDLDGLVGLDDLIELNLSRIPNNLDNGMQWIAGLHSLRRLNLDGAIITNDGIQALREHPSLEELDLSATSITDDAVEVFASLKKLRKLVLTSSKVAGIGFSSLKNVTELCVEESKVRGPGVKEICQMTQLEELNLSGIPMKASALKELPHLTKLRTLDLARCKNLDESVFAYLQNLPSLRRLSLVHTKISAAAEQQLGELLPNCRIETRGLTAQECNEMAARMRS